MKNILAISGSTREKSINQTFIKAIAQLADSQLIITTYKDIAAIPHFNPDLDNENPPPEVTDFRNQIRQADGVLICTPEYAMGVPGTLKNAIDWTVSSCEFSHKPTALITASLSGEKAHESLLGTLKIIEAKITDSTQLLIPHAKTKIDKDGRISDAETLTNICNLIVALAENCKHP